MNILKNSWGKAKILLSQLLCIGAVFTACTDDEVINQTDKAPLQVSVNTSLAKQSRAIVHGEWLPAGSTIGVSLFDTEGDDYDGQGYYNIQYKGTGEEEDQTWASMGVTPAVSANEAVLVAYHPYNDDEDLDITAIPVEIASQTDYMYSGQVTGITNAAPKADIVLDHALTAIRVKLVLGDFTGDASVSEIAVASPALASSATLNASDGSLDDIAGQGDKFTLPVDFGLVAGGTDNDIMFVPDASVESGVTTVSATIGGKKYTAGIEFDQAYKQGYIYTYTLTLNNSGFAVTKVNVNPWETGTDDSAVLQPEKLPTFNLSSHEDFYYGDEPDKNGDYHRYYNYTKLSFEEGMTILDWLNSKYNTLGITYESDEWGVLLHYNNNSYNCIYVMDNQDNETDALYYMEGLMKVIQPNDRYVLIMED